MNIHDVRVELAAQLDEITPAWWSTSLETFPDVYSGLIHIGHATEIRPDTLRSFGADIPITLWVDETNDNDAQRKLYELLSPMNGSVLRHLTSKQSTFTVFTAGDVGPRRGGPSGYLAAEIVVRVQVSTTP